MKDYVGVKHPNDISAFPSLKREALMFNKIAIPHFDRIRRNYWFGPYLPPPSSFVDELEWLIERGIVFEPKIIKDGSSDHSKLISNHDFKMSLRLEENWNKSLNKLYKSSSKKSMPEKMHELDDHFYQYAQIWLMQESIKLRILMNFDAYPVFFELAQPVQNTHAQKSDVIQIVLSALPVPDYSIPWEQIIEYRSDPDTIGKFMALRDWMSEIAKAKLSPIEVEEKLEWLIYDYQKHLKLHKLKTNAGTLETILVTGAEMLENLIKFNWGKVAKALFSLKHRQLALMESKLNAPGREVAYIVDTRDQFKS